MLCANGLAGLGPLQEFANHLKGVLVDFASATPDKLVPEKVNALGTSRRKNLVRARDAGFAAGDFEQIFSGRMNHPKFHFFRQKRDLADRFTGLLSQFDLNVSPFFVSNSQVCLACLGLETPVELCGQPSDQQNSGRAEAGCMNNLHAINRFETMVRRRMIEELSQCEPDPEQPGPV